MTLFLLHNIGPRHSSNYNTLAEILASDGPISFDGVYLNVYEHRHVLRGKDVTLFPMGDYCGLDNAFDIGQIREKYCTWAQIEEMVRECGFKLGWHSWSHRNLKDLDANQILKEITFPHWLPVTSFAYPYGAVDARVASIVEKSGLYQEAWSVYEGDGSRFQRYRRYLNW